MTFEELGLSEILLKGISDLGFISPSPVQEQAIPILLESESDFVGLAQTGTGKTAAFGLPLLQLVDSSITDTQVLVVAPTRELCVQIGKDLEAFSKYDKVRIVAVYGGSPIQKQMSALKRGAHVIVATPGRLQDLINRKAVNISNIRCVVLDEADEMLNMGFKEDIEAILAHTPDTKKVWLFSATMPAEVRRIAQMFMTNPQEVVCGRKNAGNENIDHHYYLIDFRKKYTAMKRVIDSYPDIFGIIFCRTKIETQEVAEKLIKDGYNADSLHGDLSQGQRDKVMKRYREKNLQMLVATDVAARGIDVSDVTHVIHYGLPEDVENYTHRSGRTARAGKSGISLSIIGRKDVSKIKRLEKITNRPFEKREIPGAEEVCEKQLLAFVDTLKNVEIDEDALAAHLPALESQLGELTKEDLIKKIAALQLNTLLSYYKDAVDLNEGERGGSDRRDDDDSSRIFVNAGEANGFDKGGLLRFICDTTGLEGGNIGRIDVFENFSFFQIENQYTDQILEASGKEQLEDRTVRFEVANKKKRSGGGGREGGRSRDGGGSDRRRSGGGGGGGYASKGPRAPRGEKPASRGGSSASSGRGRSRRNESKSGSHTGGNSANKSRSFDGFSGGFDESLSY